MRQLYKLREKSLELGLFKRYCDSIIKDTEKLAKLVYHSNSIEGSTMTEGDTKKVLLAIHANGEVYQQELSGNYSDEELSDATKLSEAVTVMFENVGGSLSQDLVLEMHLYACSDESAGQYKTFDNFTMHNGQKKYYLPACEVEDAMEELVREYNDSLGSIEDIALLKLKFIHIHPFGDANGRVSRLLLNWALMSNEFPPINITVEEKKEYISILHEYGETEDPEPFVKYIKSKLMDAYKEMLGDNFE